MEPIKTDGGLQVAGDEAPTGEHTVVAPLKQLFTGLRVGVPTLTVRCCGCHRQLGEGAQMSVSAYLPATFSALFSSKSSSTTSLFATRYRRGEVFGTSSTISVSSRRSI
jgi:hypothetical protein